ncbi:EngB [Desulforapulum autotrophicum HRM2]|uniref:Probable GTP-binding protein EngB n=1 Tax=Desulforapulum autotrophicum (strain ATCC 43914 / DSM 3382 / VKM B-1955 / HRM2) TaxID=177437 RepID=ENGB_DESAH|nr:ribosome biogenesis GTP-binding protein YihA/YsxC [Desulforapulum autotrophicum]C0QLA5.1 RecName: Full=Probable GTP-binding protein EngB [Desulforapulum autotrophicum HRM2]ACN14191.1 EngB [Desulforapulum autotrophicum HRM2]
MIIKDVEFIKSATKPSEYTEPLFLEVAFAGRSNVGKSSLINTLINRKSLVKTSSKPGCTQLINFFLLNGNLSLVDLPGYGYAKVSKKIRAQWGPMIERYLTVRETLRAIVLLIDMRREPQREELDLINWFTAHAIPYRIVLTKADKLSKTKQQKNISAIAKGLGMEQDRLIAFSSKTRLGRDRLWQELDTMLNP